MKYRNDYKFISDSTIDWNGYRILRINKKHYSSLIKLSRNSFGIDTTYSYYETKNDTSDFGIPDLGYIAYSSDGEPAAFYGVYACLVSLEGRTYQVAQSGDTMTHRNHTGKGLFTKLAQLTYELCREYDICFVFGFPNSNSYPGFSKKLNWEFPGKMREFKIHHFGLPILKLSKKIPLLFPLYKIHRNIINLFYRKADDRLSSSAISVKIGGVFRSKGYIKYKMDLSGSYILQMGKAKVWLKTDGFLIVGDVLLNGDSFKKFMSKLKRYSLLVGSNTIVFHTSPGTPLDSLFSEICSPNDSLPYGFIRLNDQIDPGRVGYVTADFDTF